MQSRATIEVPDQQVVQPLRPGAAHRHRQRPPHRRLQPRAGEGGLRHLPEEDRPAQAGDEAGAGGVQLRRQQDPVLLHRRRPRGLPGAGEGSGRRVPRPHRAAADRRPGRGQDAGRPGHLRPALLLRPVYGRVPARVHQDGQDPEPVPEPHQDLRHLRAADVLPEVRAGRL